MADLFITYYTSFQKHTNFIFNEGFKKNTSRKVKKKYGNLGDTILVINLEKSHRGLGISLAGHKDRNRMAVFVCGINPNGPAFKTGGIKVGDEILEVNGIVLQGRCHLNASAIIKGLPGPTFKVIILRRASALEDLAVKPITQFPLTLDDEQKYAKFKGVKTITIKKGNQNLGIMIIEGKHAEVGQGIFISDIQEGSSAEQAGLTVGDMILAVNKDTLLGTNYDSAATLLKKTEGLVTLVICNPNKGREEEKTVMGSLEPKGTGGHTPNRSPTPVQKEPEKSRLIPFTNLKPLKSSSSPSKQLFDVGGSGTINESQISNFVLTAPTTLVPTATITPKTSPALSTRKCTSNTKIPEEPLPDPATCPIIPGKEILIEINKDKLGLGLSIIGGCDTLLGAVIVHEIYPESAAEKDGRLEPGDQILEVNSEDVTKMPHSKVLTVMRQTQAKVKLLVYRDENITKENLLQTIDVDLIKKPGKGLGLSVAAKKEGKQVFISEIVHNGIAELDGRLMKGDYILEVNGISLKESNQEIAAAVLKSCTGKVAIKVGRITCKKHVNNINGR
ncbi:Inactivation-no-after-potential D protein, putative [Pediculus humanus corporis]|uniref:Inactivation-no-after-potential D protein, putative n=1 Tax=Pediculus humanus subsp. corporis TaxID=121224 RepID=E0VYT7_PEDHC|nr:Inactivation-no-after-potential D protein, putative [Pediculus humanus corporis]EEB18543.1 Inactivation-no-after-potential D protein, putative [Pediculus humanus corporis]